MRSECTVVDLFYRVKTVAWVNGLFFVFILSMFLLDDKLYARFFYIFLTVPGFFVMGRYFLKERFGKEFIFMCSAVLLYYAASALWGEIDQLYYTVRNSTLVFLLMVLSLLFTQDVKLSFFKDIVFAFVVLFSMFLLGMFWYGHELGQLLDARHSLSKFIKISENNPIDSGVILGVVFIFFLDRVRSISVRYIPFLFLLSLGILLLLVLTKSRGPQLFLCVTAALYMLIARDKRTVVFIIALCVSAIIASYVMDFQPYLFNRIGTKDYRFEIWGQTLLLIKSSWLFGTGAVDNPAIVVSSGSFTVTHAHSFLIDALRIGGLVGFSGLLTLIIYVLLNGSYSKDYHFLIFWLLFGSLCLLTNGRSPIMQPNVEWFAFWTPLFLWFFYSLREVER